MNETDFPPGVRATLIIVMCLGVMLAVVLSKVGPKDSQTSQAIFCVDDPTHPDFGKNCP